MGRVIPFPGPSSWPKLAADAGSFLPKRERYELELVAETLRVHLALHKAASIGRPPHIGLSVPPITAQTLFVPIDAVRLDGPCLSLDLFVLSHFVAFAISILTCEIV